MIALVTISDGRGHLTNAVRSLLDNTPPGTFSAAVMVDDSAQHPVMELDPATHEPVPRHSTDEAFDLLHAQMPVKLTCHAQRRGGAAAIQTAWGMLPDTGCDYAFHLEEDWTFPGPVPVAEMVDILKIHRQLANVVLRRQPWGNEGPGGYIGDDVEAFDLYSGALFALGRGQIAKSEPFEHHRKGFWLNPCLYRVSLTEKYPWPDRGHESDYSLPLVADGYSFAVYGTRYDDPRAIHVGNQRHPSWTW